MAKPVLFIRGGGGEIAYEADGLLVASLRNALGAAYEVRYPKMPLDDSAGYADWKADIATELSALDEVILVAHSVGGSILLKYLVEEQVGQPIIGLFLLATPYFGADEKWDYAEMILPQDFAAMLPPIPRILLYHSRDDEVVPFAHLALYAARLPRATIRERDGGGHQLRNDLADVAEDIKRAETRPSRWVAE
ncbi:MAG TPA: alpha/beta hydrolase [Thermoanaerobaculia bacterium]